LIADAPPHGIEPSGDGFPNGCPCGTDPLKIAKQMAERGIIIYAVAVEPNLSNFKYARDFMRSIAKITTGQFLPLTNAKLLPKAIVGGAIEELSLNSVMEEVVSEVQQLKIEHAEMTEKEVVAKISERLKEKKIVTNQMRCDDVYGGKLTDEAVDCFEKSESLSTAKTRLPSSGESRDTNSSTFVTSSASPTTASPVRSFFSKLFSSSSSPSSAPPAMASAPMYASPATSSVSVEEKEQSVDYFQDVISEEQVERMYHKGKHMNRY